MTAMLIRVSFVSPGHDCIRHPCGKYGCGTNAGNNHGIHYDEWNYVVSDGQVALHLCVSSWVFPASVPLDDHLCSKTPEGMFFQVHRSFPTCREEVKDQDQHKCEFVTSNRCFTDEPQYLRSEALHKELDAAPKFEQEEPFWLRLEAAWEKLAKPVYDERMDFTYERCLACDGTGTVHKVSATEKTS